MGRGKMEREKVAGQRENQAGESSGLRIMGGGGSRVAETPGKIAREWEGKTSHQGTSPPLEWKSSQGDKTSGVIPDGDIVPEADVWGQVGDRNSPATRDNDASGDSSSSEEMTSEPGPAALQRPHQGTAEGAGSQIITHRHPNGADSSRPEYGYDLLAPVTINNGCASISICLK